MKVSKLYSILKTQSYREIETMMLIKRDDTVITESHILVVIKSSTMFDEINIQDIPNSGILIPKSLVAKMRNDNVKGITYDKATKTLSIPGKEYSITAKVQDNGFGTTYPNYKAVLENFSKKPIDSIGVQGSLLKVLGDVFPDAINFEFKSGSSSMRLRVKCDLGEIEVKNIILMPTMIEF